MLDRPIDGLVARAQQGDRQALEELLAALHGEFLVLIRAAHLHANDWEDAAQHAVVVTIHCVESYERRLGPFEAYVAGSVRQMLRGFRSLGPQSLDCVPEPTYERSDAVLEARELIERATSPEVVRRYFGIGQSEQSLNQIAAAIGKSPASVKTMLCESLRAMREAL